MIGLNAETQGTESLLPKSRTVPLGYGEIPPDMNLWDFNYYVYDCLIPYTMQRSLLYYASRFNWETREPCYVSFQRMANDLKVGRKYLKEPLMKLEQYGWVRVEEDRGDNNVFIVTPLIGHEVPEEKWKERTAKKKQLTRDNSKSSRYKRVKRS
jgi:hypothetical protein